MISCRFECFFRLNFFSFCFILRCLCFVFIFIISHFILKKEFMVFIQLITIIALAMCSWALHLCRFLWEHTHGTEDSEENEKRKMDQIQTIQQIYTPNSPNDLNGLNSWIVHSEWNHYDIRLRLLFSSILLDFGAAFTLSCMYHPHLIIIQCLTIQNRKAWPLTSLSSSLGQHWVHTAQSQYISFSLLVSNKFCVCSYFSPLTLQTVCFAWTEFISIAIVYTMTTLLSCALGDFFFFF